MNINAKTKLCMIIGDPVEHSLSPQMHNAGYEALGIDSEFVFVAAHVKLHDLESFIESVRVMSIRGVCCTIPHKEMIMQYLDKIDPVAEKIGAVNTIVNENGRLVGYNTDWIGVLKPLEQLTQLKRKKVGVIGAGGAARAVVYALKQANSNITIYNRTFEHAKLLADEFNCLSKSLDDLKDAADADIILNATSVGLNSLETPLPAEYINENQIVFDAVYSPYETKLLQDAKAKGARVIHGTEMLLYQGAAQFKLFTVHDAPIEAMRKELLRQLEI